MLVSLSVHRSINLVTYHVDKVLLLPLGFNGLVNPHLLHTFGKFETSNVRHCAHDAFDCAVLMKLWVRRRHDPYWRESLTLCTSPYTLESELYAHCFLLFDYIEPQSINDWHVIVVYDFSPLEGTVFSPFEAGQVKPGLVTYMHCVSSNLAEGFEANLDTVKIS